MANFDYITNFVSGSKSAKMALNRAINNGPNGINGPLFVSELDYLVAQGVEEVVIDINSPGGSIVEGFAIFKAIQDAPIKTITRVVGMAASMAGIISQAGDKRVIMDYGIFHAHGPQVPEGAKVEESLVAKMLGSLKIMIRAKSDISEAEVDEMLSKETFMTALEAKQKGFFDEIEMTRGVKPRLNASLDIEELYLIANEFITNPNKMNKLSELLALENATEEQIIDSVKGLQAKAGELESLTNEVAEKNTQIEALTNDLEAVKAEGQESKVAIEDLTAKIEALKVSAATDFVENSIKLGKITEAKKASWIELATNDLDKAKELIGAVKGVSVAADLKNEIKKDAKNSEDRKEWDFQKWGQEDPKGLEAMMTENPEEYQALFDAYINN